MEWSLQPVLPRQEFFTKEIRRLLRGGGIGSGSRGVIGGARGSVCGIGV